MRMASLAHEMRSAVAAMQWSDIADLVRIGIPEILLTHFQMAGLARVREVRPDLYEPDPRSGSWSYITPVLVQYPDTPESTAPDTYQFIGNIVDLVAWCEKRPERWRLRGGSASWLGCIEPQYMNPDPVAIFRSPLSWLRNRCVGLVPLSRDRGEIYQLLTGCVSGIIAEDPRHEAELKDILWQPFRRPPVYVAHPPERRRAA